MPTAPKLRHSARSRGIHLCLPTHQPENPAPSALHYGYCDFAQYDGVGRARASLSSGTPLPSFPKYLSNPNTVILVVPAEPKLRHSPQCPPPPNPVIPRSTLCTQTSSFRAQSRNPSRRCQRIRQRSQCPLHSTMDTATSRSMTVLVGQGRLCPLALFSRHSRSSCRIQTSSFRAQSRNPSPRYQRIRQLRNPAPSAPKPRHSPKCPLHPNFVIPRAVAESISALPTHQAEKPAPSALHYGYCDFAQYDGVGRARASLTFGTLLPSFPKYPPNWNAVIPEVPAEPKRRHSRSTCRMTACVGRGCLPASRLSLHPSPFTHYNTLRLPLPGCSSLSPSPLTLHPLPLQHPKLIRLNGLVLCCICQDQSQVGGSWIGGGEQGVAQQGAQLCSGAV